MFMPVICIPRNLVQSIKQTVDPLSQHLILTASQNIGIKNFFQMLDPCSQNFLHTISILQDHLKAGLLFIQQVHLETI